MPACTLLAGARLSAGPAVDTDGNVGVELAVGVFWGAGDENGTPMVDDRALLETARFGGGVYPAEDRQISVSVALEYVAVPLRLGVGIGLRGPIRDENDAEQDQGGTSDLISLEFAAARVWAVREKRRSVTLLGVELHCGYRFLADHATCSLGPSVQLTRYKRFPFPR